MLVDVLVDDDAELQPAGRRAAARQRVRAHDLGQPLQRRRPGQLVEDVALGAGDRHRRPGRAAALAHGRADGDVAADEQPDGAVRVHLAVEEQPVRPGPAARARQAAHHRQRAGVRQEPGERERVRVDEQRGGPLVAVERRKALAGRASGRNGRSRAPGRVAAQTATAGPWSTPRPSPHTPRGGGADRGARAARAHHLPGRGLDEPGPGGDTGRDEHAHEVGRRAVEGSERLGQRDLRGAFEIRTDGEPVAEVGAGRRRGSGTAWSGAGGAGAPGTRPAVGSPDTPIPLASREDPASGRGGRSQGVHTRHRTPGTRASPVGSRDAWSTGAPQQQVHPGVDGPVAHVGAPARQPPVAGHDDAGRGRHAETDVADGLGRRAAVRAGDAGDPDADVRAERGPRAVRHRPGDLRRHRAVRLDQLGRHAEQRRLGRVRVRHDPAQHVGRRPRPVDQPAGQQPAGARLGGGHRQAPVEQRPGEQLVGARAVRADRVVSTCRSASCRGEPLCGVLRAGLRPQVDLQLGAAQAGRHLDDGEVALLLQAAQRRRHLRLGQPVVAQLPPGRRRYRRQQRLHRRARQRARPHARQLARRPGQDDDERAVGRSPRRGRAPCRPAPAPRPRAAPAPACAPRRRARPGPGRSAGTGRRSRRSARAAPRRTAARPRRTAATTSPGQVVGRRPEPAAGDDEHAAGGRAVAQRARRGRRAGRRRRAGARPRNPARSARAPATVRWRPR